MRVVLSSLIITLAISVVTSIVRGAPPDSEAFEYWAWTTPTGDEHYRLEPPSPGKTGRIVFAGHVFEDAEFCEAESPLACFHSGRLSFAVPRGLSAEQKSWVYRGVTFAIVERDLSVTLLGRRIHGLIHIESPLRGHTMGWLYSTTMGLVAFGRWGPDGSCVWPIHWLQGDLGFGAQP